jgi:hypothetical protein
MDIRAKKDGVFMEGLVAEGDEVNKYICLCTYTCVYIYIYVCIYTYIYMNTYTYIISQICGFKSIRYIVHIKSVS